METYGDRDGDGFLEYSRRTERGLENQSWKDSFDSQRFATGGGRGPIAPVEAQGYAYDARLRVAELARACGEDEALATRLEVEAEAAGPVRRGLLDRGATDLRARARRLEGTGRLAVLEHRAPALVGDRSGAPPRRRRRALTAGGLWSGWGVRTMGAGEGAYNPLSYHNGTVWPHDTALAAWGLARAGYRAGAVQLACSLLEASCSFDYSLPEVFAGFARDETAFPIAYPTAARPQAWAAGAPVLCLTLLLGLRPDPTTRSLVSHVDGILPDWLEGTRLEGVRAFGEMWNVAVSDGVVRILPAS